MGDTKNAGIGFIHLSGYEKNSVIADPLFNNAENYDFSFATGSPAPGMGIEAINYSAAGLTEAFLYVGIDS
jgi:hypothetical protein